jgi:two-component system, sensor histidine kinase and response regulator
MAGNPGRAPSVLVVDDNEQNRALARATLEQEDYHVVLASSGQQALESFQKQRPDCILLDVRMPGMDGPETCRRLRELPGGGDVPVIFLTASRDVDTFEAAQAAGGDDFLTKPVQPAELLLRVQAALRMRELDATNRQNFELIRKQRDDLLRLQLQKERLTAFVVHDLKSPVSTVDLLAQVLRRDKNLPAEARETADAIRLEVASLMRLILNLLDISKAEEGALSVSPARFDFMTFVEPVLEAIRVRAAAKEITITSQIGQQEVSADQDLLRRVLENLLDNALRYAPKGSAVTLATRSHPGEVEIRIADQGGGVPPEMRESIFDRFVQLEHKDRTAPRTGRGLGLTFCRLAVEAHGGRIYVEEGEPGTVFCLRLPHAD